MPSNKNQHFVPQFYLRLFAETARGSSISLFNIRSRRHIERAAISGQCAHSWYYGRDPKIEAAIQFIEGLGTSVIRKICETGIVPPRLSEDSEKLRMFLMLQLGRTPGAAREQDAMATAIARRTIQAFVQRNPSAPPDVLNHLEDLLIRYKMPVLNSIKACISAVHSISDLHSKLIVNASPIEFVTSDVAVVLHNKWLEECPPSPMGPTGLLRQGLLVFLPLGPRRQVVLFDDWAYRIGPDGFDAVTVKSRQEINQLNAMHYVTAEENLYYSGHPETAEAIDQINAPRATRESRIWSQRAVAEDGTSDLIVMSTGSSPIRLDLPWIKVTRHANAMDIVTRQNACRPRAVAIDRLIRQKDYEAARPAAGGPTSWAVVPDPAK